MFLQACLNGTRPRGDHDALPLTPDELARDALEVAAAGAGARSTCTRAAPTAPRASSPSTVGAAVAALREAAPKLEISLSTGCGSPAATSRGALELRATRGPSCPTACSLNVIEEGWRELASCWSSGRLRSRPASGAPSHPASSPPAGWSSRCRRALVEPQETRAGDRRRHRRRRSTAGSGASGIELPQLHHGYDHTTWAVLDAAARRGREIADRPRGHATGCPTRAARARNARARRGRRRALRQLIRLTASSAATL